MAFNNVDALGVAPKGAAPLPTHPQLMLWFTYYKGTFSTFVFASQNRAFMLRSVLRTPSGPPGS
jgi:hypothetical protein